MISASWSAGLLGLMLRWEGFDSVEHLQIQSTKVRSRLRDIPKGCSIWIACFVGLGTFVARNQAYEKSRQQPNQQQKFACQSHLAEGPRSRSADDCSRLGLVLSSSELREEYYRVREEVLKLENVDGMYC